MRRWVIINVLLGLGVVLLGLEIVSTWARVLPTVEAPAHQPAPERREKGKRANAKLAAAQAQQTPTAMLAVISDRDVFDPSRRAAAEEVKAEAPKEIGPPPGLTVTGVRIVGKDREVFITDASQGNAQRRLRVGDQIGGYTVKSIVATGLTLASPSGDSVTMPLEVEKGKAPAMPRGPAPPRPGQPPPPMTSPAAGVQAPPPGVGVRPPLPGMPTQAVPPPPVPAPQPAGVPGAQNPQLQQMPAEVRQKLEQLKQNEANPRTGRKR